MYCGPSLQELRESWTEASQQTEFKGPLYDLREVARKVPGFGGLSVIPMEDGPDTLVIRLVDPDSATAEEARRAYVDQVSMGRDHVSPSVEEILHQPLKIVATSYNLVQKYQWMKLMGHYLMPVPHVNGVGLQAEGIYVSVLDEERENAVGCVRQRLDSLSIPQDAVQFKIRGPVVPNEMNE